MIIWNEQHNFKMSIDVW